MSQPTPKRGKPIDRQETYLRRVEKKANANTLHPLPKISRAAGLAQLLAFPVIIGYFMFGVDHGEKEHVFSEPQRWFERQKRELWGVSEQAGPGSSPSSEPTNPSPPTGS